MRAFKSSCASLRSGRDGRCHPRVSALQYSDAMLRSSVASLVAVFVVVVLSRSSRAGPPPPSESRPVGPILEALVRSKADASTLATVRWFIEVPHGTHLTVAQGSAPTSLGLWGDNGALLDAEAALGSCEPLAPGDAKKAIALHDTFKDALPPSLRAVALAEKGDPLGAAKLSGELIRSSLTAEGCPSEHPMYSHRRVGRLERLVSCVKRWQPQADHAAIERVLQRARRCALDNHAVG